MSIHNGQLIEVCRKIISKCNGQSNFPGYDNREVTGLAAQPGSKTGDGLALGAKSQWLSPQAAPHPPALRKVGKAAVGQQRDVNSTVKFGSAKSTIRTSQKQS
eukprot:3527959-Amphidinium_carterae.1